MGLLRGAGGLSRDGTYKIECTTFTCGQDGIERYSEVEINDLANLALKANRKISARRPATYFAELESLDSSRLAMTPRAAAVIRVSVARQIGVVAEGFDVRSAEGHEPE